MAETRMAYVSRIASCGCITAATVDVPEHARDTAKFVGKEIRAGFRVERIPVEEARTMPWGWPCEHMKAAGPEVQGGD